MKKALLILFVCFYFTNVFTQENKEKKSNPIIFVDITLGYSFVNTGVLMGTINYQTKNNLFTYRFSELSHITNFSEAWAFIIPIYPLFTLVLSPIKSKEYAFLYGKRYINNGFSYSFSGGVSYIKHTDFPKYNNSVFEQSFIGFPFEANIKWFKSEKRRFFLFGVFPIGKPFGFGGGIGFKLFGNLSKHPYIGLGITLGLGYYKNYH